MRNLAETLRLIEKKHPSCYSIDMDDSDWKDIELTKKQREDMKWTQWVMSLGGGYSISDEYIEELTKRRIATEEPGEYTQLLERSEREGIPLAKLIHERAEKRHKASKQKK